MDTPATIQQAMESLAAGKLDNAETISRQILQAKPDQHEAFYVLAVVESKRAHPSAAVRLLQDALRLQPNESKYHAALGETLLAIGDLDQAAVSVFRALTLKRDSPELCGQLALVFARMAETGARPDAVQKLVEMITAVSTQLSRFDGEALEAYRSTLARADEWSHALRSIIAAWPANITPPLAARQPGRLGLAAQRQHEFLHLQAIDALMLRNQWDAASDELERALAGASGPTALHERLGTLHARRGEVEPARHHLNEVLRADPNNAAAGSRLLVMLNYDSHASPQKVYDAHREWAERHAAPLTRAARRQHANSPDAQRRLRIGYVSPDFKDHPIGSFTKSVLASHDSAGFDVTCFSDVASPDVFTTDLRKHAANWRNTRDLRDDALAEQIAAEGIDILVDLTGHTPDNRLLAFARRPAPVQITWLGYCNTTGMDAMDWIVGDDITDPPQATQPYAERVLRLSSGFSCYAPRFDAPAVNELPAKSRDVIVLGAFHKPIKLNDATLDLWASVLRALPNTHLLLWRDMMRGRAAERVRAAMEARGIPADRFTLRGDTSGEGSHLGMYHSVEISLDTLPWSGHTTACESLWMGVPFVTIRGDTHASRMAASALWHAGAGEFVADSTEQYIETVKRLVNDRAQMADLRRTLRSRMQNSRLTDGSAFTAAWESALREVWAQWCSAQDKK